MSPQTWTTLVCQTLRILQDLVTPTQEEIQSQESSDATIDSFYSFVTVKLLEVFDTAYVSTLGQVIRKDFPLTNDGFVTTEWREAYDEYCALIIQGAPHVIQDVEQLPVGLPTPWYELRTTFSSMVVKRIRLAAAAATASPPNATRIQTTLPWFSESVADDFLLLAQQVGPAMSIVSLSLCSPMLSASGNFTVVKFLSLTAQAVVVLVGNFKTVQLLRSACPLLRQRQSNFTVLKLPALAVQLVRFRRVTLRS